MLKKTALFANVGFPKRVFINLMTKALQYCLSIKLNQQIEIVGGDNVIYQPLLLVMLLVELNRKVLERPNIRGVRCLFLDTKCVSPLKNIHA